MGYYAQQMIGEQEEMRQDDTGEAEYWSYVETVKAEQEHEQYLQILTNDFNG
ncbi:MAG: hypothetical protein PHT07_20825 [Paludibacter sp.]|nr:hypothetical protein [Paludibacter sp.]